MANCENLSGCPFFNNVIPNMPITAQYLKKTYCTGDPLQCARYVICKALGKDKVPLELFPEELDKARRIIQMRG
jgi:hypothetical protein